VHILQQKALLLRLVPQAHRLSADDATSRRAAAPSSFIASIFFSQKFLCTLAAVNFST